MSDAASNASARRPGFSELAGEPQMPAAADRQGGVEIAETYWGYIIRAGGKSVSSAGLGEIVAALGCVVFGILAYCQWLLPGSSHAPEVLPFKIGATVIFFLFAGLLYAIARKGLIYEIQVDTRRQVIRTARRNREGESTLLDGFGFDDVAELAIVPGRGLRAKPMLVMELMPGNRVLAIASGDHEALASLMARLAADVDLERRGKGAEGGRSVARAAEGKKVRTAFAAY